MSWFVVLCMGLLISSAIQFLLVAGFVRKLRQPTAKLITDEEAPAAMVVLCLRGGDPFLKRCLDGLIEQDYPNYHVCFMVDSESDPSLLALGEVLGGSSFANYEIRYLVQPLTTCSLKCSSLITALAPRINSDGFVAFLDADTIPHKTWLRELATSLQSNDVGAASGNRWYIPERASLGAMVRHVWNGAAVVQMYWYEIAWGGSLALKWDSIRRANLLERWSHALCEDTMLFRELKSISQRVAFVPTCMMINREICSLSSFFEWVMRQLLTARLYHPKWPAVVVHGISSAGLLVCGWIGCLVSLIYGDLPVALLYAMAMSSYHVFLTIMLPWMESAVLEIAKRRGEGVGSTRPIGWLQYSWFVWSTQWVYTVALLSCLNMKRVLWRGIQYEVRSAFQIRMLGYKSYEAEPAPKSQLSQSL
ncbi:MAG: glycosyltransferase family 2 protein [Pirellula sp.]